MHCKLSHQMKCSNIRGLKAFQLVVIIIIDTNRFTVKLLEIINVIEFMTFQSLSLFMIRAPRAAEYIEFCF